MNFESINDVTMYLKKQNIESKNVAILDISFNNIKKVTKKEMGEFPNLIAINISQNRIKKIDSNAFDTCKLLILINLQFNQIQSGLSRIIEKFHESSDIRLSTTNNNPITDAESNSLYTIYSTMGIKAQDRKNNIICYFHTQDFDPRRTDLVCTAIGIEKDDAAKKLINFSGGCPDQKLSNLFEQENYEHYNPFLHFKFRNFITIARKIAEEIKQDKLLEDTLNDLLD